MRKYAVEGLDGYPNELAHKLDDALQQNADLLAALKANMDWIGRPPVDRHSYDSKREDAWEMGKRAIADAEAGER